MRTGILASFTSQEHGAANAAPTANAPGEYHGGCNLHGLTGPDSVIFSANHVLSVDDSEAANGRVAVTARVTNAKPPFAPHLEKVRLEFATDSGNEEIAYSPGTLSYTLFDASGSEIEHGSIHSNFVVVHRVDVPTWPDAAPPA